jgi:hypothetical protein
MPQQFGLINDVHGITAQGLWLQQQRAVRWFNLESRSQPRSKRKGQKVDPSASAEKKLAVAGSRLTVLFVWTHN